LGLKYLQYQLFGLCWDIIAYLFILGSPFYYSYNAKKKKKLRLIGTNFIGVIYLYFFCQNG
jgi:hypothetical protein